MSRYDPSELARVLEGRWCRTPYGDCLVVTGEYPADHRLGPLSLGDFLSTPLSTLLRLVSLAVPERLDPRSLAVLDIETTGLAGGTGTYVFLVGLGAFHGNTFRVDQFFMADYDQEAAMLHQVQRSLSTIQGLITFNGKAFDVPLLETRYRLARQETNITDLPNLDLLLPARRIWKTRLSSHSLASLEQQVLGIYRRDDVSSALIPSLYFQYLREGHLEPLVAIFNHNAQDILGTLAIGSYLASILLEPNRAKDPLDLYSIGRVYETLGELKASTRWYEAALGYDMEPESKSQAYWRLGLAYKRLKHWKKALESWKAAVEHNPSVAPLVEIAKYYEHRANEYPRALYATTEALALVTREQKGLESTQYPRLRAELEHRLARVQRKSARYPLDQILFQLEREGKGSIY